MSGLSRIDTVWHFDDISEVVSEKFILKKKADFNKAFKITQHVKSFKNNCITYTISGPYGQRKIDVFIY